MRLIDADAANVDNISCYYGAGAYLDDVQEWLDDQPTVDPVKHGVWEGIDGSLRVRCSVCQNKDTLIGSQPNHYMFYAYCPDCGAKMDLEE